MAVLSGVIAYQIILKYFSASLIAASFSGGHWGCFALHSSHIQLIHADVHLDVPLDMEFGQKENRFAMA